MKKQEAKRAQIRLYAHLIVVTNEGRHFGGTFQSSFLEDERILY